MDQRLHRSYQFSQRPQVSGVPRVHVGPAPAFRSFELRRFEQHRKLCKSTVVQQAAKGFQSETALADVLVAIDTASAGLLRIIEVKESDAVETDHAIELAERASVAFDRAEIVACGQEVTGIEADANPRGSVEAV